MGKKRYVMFKSALYLSLKSKEFQYEDYLRSIYGKQVRVGGGEMV